MREPNAEDATLLLQLESLRYTEPIDQAFSWAWKHFQDKAPPSAHANVMDRAEAERAIGTFSTFFETAGVLVRDGLLHEDVFYDRYAVTPFWKLASEATDRSRKEAGTAAMGENFEWLAKHEDAAHARIDDRHRKGAKAN